MIKNNTLPAEQSVYAARAAALAVRKYGENPKACVVTFGCQQNVSDSERMKGMLVQSGYTLTDDISEAHFILFNTCAERRRHCAARLNSKPLKLGNAEMLVEKRGGIIGIKAAVRSFGYHRRKIPA